MQTVYTQYMNINYPHSVVKEHYIDLIACHTESIATQMVLVITQVLHLQGMLRFR